MGEHETKIGVLLRRWEAGAPPPDELVAALYRELRGMAARALRRESPGHTLQPTALVHEAWMRLAAADAAPADRAHFLALAARTMRRILVDHARAKRSGKRSGGTMRVELDEGAVASAETTRDVLRLDDALKALARDDPRMSRIVELHYFGGLEYDEIATALSISAATVGRELRLARAWLRRALAD